MRILFLTSRLPFPPDRGDRLRAFNIIRSLSSDGHEIHLASFIASERERQGAGPLGAYCRTVHLVHRSPGASWLSCAGAVAKRVPLQVAYYTSSKMAATVDQLLDREQIDLVYVHLFRMAAYISDGRPEYKVVDFTDVISREIDMSMSYRRGLDRLLYASELPRIRAFEISVARTFNECWVVSDAEAEVLRELCPSANVHVIPNGVDLDRFRPLETQPGNIVSFVGHLGVPHNIDAVLHFYDHIFPEVLRERPDCRFCIIGPSAHRSLRRLESDRRVLMTGFVEDLNASLNRSAVFVAPLRYCAGLQNKVLEAMAAGVPVVATPCVNEGLQAEADEEIVLASEPLDFALRVTELLRDAALRTHIGLNGRKFAERKFSWKTARERMSVIGASLGR
ncbi:MAG: glycosyltransferase [Candidatus Eiseniibacteriota bacterium]|nr:MAG: glycosyltransferase [Candidatus Eisenbacteria bacterium]